MRLSKAFAELSKSKLGPAALRLGFLSALRFDSTAALEYGLVDSLNDPEELVASAIDKAQRLQPSTLRFANYDPNKYGEIKKELYTDAFRALTMGVITSAPE